MENFESQFKIIGIVARLGSAKVVETLRHLMEILGGYNFEIVLERMTSELILDHGCKTADGKNLAKKVDLIIVVGGDGSLLGTVRNIASENTPVIGINRGNLGFLTDIAPDNLEQELLKVLAGYFTEETRLLIEVEIWRDDMFLKSSLALNDVVLHPGKTGRMISYTINIDHHLVYQQKGDGIIVSTPTGSTAYALSAGGPILHPALKVIELVPIMPHILSSRPIVVSSSSLINIIIDADNKVYPQVICDGQVHLPCNPGDILLIKESPYQLKILHPCNHNFYEICRNKLGWNNKALGTNHAN